MKIQLFAIVLFGLLMWGAVFLRLQSGAVERRRPVVRVYDQGVKTDLRGARNRSRTVKKDVESVKTDLRGARNQSRTVKKDVESVSNHGVVTILEHEKKPSKPIMAVCACTRSKPDWKHFPQTAVARYLIPSLKRTVTQEERDTYDMRLYICHDDDDMFWERHKKEIQVPDWLTLEVLVYKKQTKHKIPFNPFMRDVYESGAEYMTRINDDTEFVTSGWVSKAIAQLKKMDNVGVVGPTCREGNTGILTHDMVHRTHLEIFDTYYSNVFSAWYIDDWITRVYEPGRMVKMSDWVVKHHTGMHGTRYTPQMNEHRLVDDEVRKGQERLKGWLIQQKQIKSWTVLISVSSGFDDMFTNWWYHYSKLNLDMDVIMIAEDEATLKKYSSFSKIKVWKSEYKNSKGNNPLTYDTNQYKQLVSRRASHILRILDSNLKIIYTDIDTVWLKDPRPFLIGNFDIWAQLDDVNYYCTGFMAIKKSNAVVDLLRKWNKKLSEKTQLNQPIFNKIIHKSNVKHKALPLIEFPSGKLYFQEKKRHDVAIVHNNFIIGKDKKIQRFKDVGLWLPFSFQRARVTEPPPGTQMGRKQIHEILSVLPKNGNLLVWGLGNDSPFWNDSTEGKVVFIEDDIPEKKAGTLWFDVITSKYNFLEAYKVHYTTDTVKSYDKYMKHSELWDTDLDIRDQLPASVTNTRWDVIIVDAPLGCCDAGPGRYQSIYTTKLLSNPDTHVFIDDFERKVEKDFSLKVFDKQPMNVVTRRAAASNANFQAHFVHVSSVKQPCTHIITDSDAGIFSNMMGVLSGLAQYGPNVLVQWSNKLYMADSSNNVWTQYFEPISDCIPDDNTEYIQLAGWSHFKFEDTEATLSPQARKIKLNAAMLSELDKYKWSSKNVLGVHIRSTDRISDTQGIKMGLHIIPDERYIRYIDKYLKAHTETARIFIASDYQPSLDRMKQIFGDKVIHIDCVRSNGSNSIHHGKVTNPFDIGKSAVLDAWLLSKTKYKILSSSQLNVFSLLMQGENAGFELLNELDGYTRYRDLFTSRDKTQIGVYPPKKDVDFFSKLASQTECLDFENTEIIYNGVTWYTPKKLCTSPIHHASILPSGLIFNATSSYAYNKWYWKKDVSKITTQPTEIEPINTFISFVQIWQDTFQHITFDTYPKSKLLCPYMKQHPNIGILVSNNLQRDLIIESCAISRGRFKNLVKTISANYISATVWSGDFKMGIIPPDSFTSLGPQNKQGDMVIYIPRKKGTSRSVSNEEVVLNVLRAYFGDKLIVYYPKNKWLEDRTVFESASIIVGPHGGAMANMIFAPVKTTIIEFLPLTRLKKLGENERPCYFGLARGMGFDYHAVEPIDFDFDKPMSVPIKELKQILNVYTRTNIRSNIQEDVLPESINEYIHLSNVALQHDKVHIYAPTQRVRNLLQGVKSLPPYKRFVGGKQLYDLPTPEIIIHDEFLNPNICENGKIRQEHAYFWSPWHTDNMFHLHNDNMLPLIDNILHTPGCNGLTCKMQKTLYEFQGDHERSKHEVQMIHVLRNDIFDRVVQFKDVFKPNKMVCISQISWGRGPYFFYMKQPWYVNGKQSDIYPLKYWTQGGTTAIQTRAVDAVKALHGLYDVYKRSSNEIKAIYVERTGTRNIKNSEVIMSACTDMGWSCQRCCDWATTTYEDTIRLFSEADVVIGPHGAGLTHILYARKQPHLIDFGMGDQWVAEFSSMARANNGNYIRVPVKSWPATITKEQVLNIFRKLTFN